MVTWIESSVSNTINLSLLYSPVASETVVSPLASMHSEAAAKYVH